jgi:DNA polymerase I-like protein with 3'-5' exonuclease and polymerase domains
LEKTLVSYITNEKAFRETLDRILKLEEGTPIGLDTETTGLDWFSEQLTLIQVGNSDWVNIYDVRELPMRSIRYILELLSTKEVICHNAKFDLHFIYEKTGVLLTRVYDTQLGEILLHAGILVSYPHLVDLVKKYFNAELKKEIRNSFIGNPNVVITPEILEYSANDVVYLPDIRRMQLEELEKRKELDVVRLEMELLPHVMVMEHMGIILDIEKWKKLTIQAEGNVVLYDSKIKSSIGDCITSIVSKNKFDSALDALEYFKISFSKTLGVRKEMRGITDEESIVQTLLDNFNTNSNLQMARIMRLMGIEVENTSAKYLKRDFKDNEFTQLLTTYREWEKLATSFGDNFAELINKVTGRIHTTLDQLGTATGRFASYKPNMQNIKADTDYRECFKARPGMKLISADYSQIELRMAAEVTNEDVMLNAFRENKDLHTLTAAAVYEIAFDAVDDEIRKRGKSINFATIYGTSAKGLAYNFAIPYEEGVKLLENFRKTYPKFTACVGLIHKQILTRGYSVTPLGRRRYFKIPKKFTPAETKLMFKVMREGFNHVVQGGCADMLKIAMLNIARNNPFGDKLRMLLQVHDELVVEVAEDTIDDAEKFIKHEMLDAASVFIKSIPVEVTIKHGDFWRK